MKLKSITCPICKRKIQAYNPDFLKPALDSHIQREHPAPKPRKRARANDEHPYDFSHSGLGIGGLGSYQEEPIIPTVAQLERLERMEARATTCRRCGDSDVFDGAMFTTVGGNICDDCCG